MSTEESQFNVQGYNIVTILKRLEAATSRLEDITIFQELANKALPANGANGVHEAVTETPSTNSVITDAPAASKEVDTTASLPVIVDFNALISGLSPFVEHSKSIDQLVGDAAQLLVSAFENQREFIKIAIQSKKPNFNDKEFLDLLTPINELISKIVEIKDKNRTSHFFNHLNTISEGSPVLGWIVSETPVSFIPEYKDSAKFWGDRILKEYREKEESHVQWVKEFLQIFDDLKDYVKKYHTTGPAWNNQGKPLSEVVASMKSTTAGTAKSGGVPPPPPPPPADLFKEDSEAAPTGINAVFAEINKGSAITSGLRKVDKSEMTHKNPSLRQNAPISEKRPVPPKKPSSLSSIKKKPARKELVDGTKWLIENYTKQDAQEPIVIDAEMSHSIFIGNCQDITIQIKGKANALSISDTKSIGVVVDSLISGIDVIKSFKLGLQVLEVVPMINIDKSDEVSTYVSQKSIDEQIQIFSSCSTALNINVPTNEDFEELAVPEQFKHTVVNGKLVSEVVEHAG